MKSPLLDQMLSEDPEIITDSFQLLGLLAKAKQTEEKFAVRFNGEISKTRLGSGFDHSTDNMNGSFLLRIRPELHYLSLGAFLLNPEIQNEYFAMMTAFALTGESRFNPGKGHYIEFRSAYENEDKNFNVLVKERKT